MGKRKQLDQGLLRQARKARINERLAHVDYLRALCDAAAAMSQTQVAAALGISQPAVSQSCTNARLLGRVPEGMMCASPTEAIRRYLVGQLTAAAAAKEIAAFGADATAAVQEVIDCTDCIEDDLVRLIASLREEGVHVANLTPPQGQFPSFVE